MKEIGGYIELDKYRLPMLHSNAIKLNCARNALAYLIEAYSIKKIAMPKFMCDSCECVFQRYNTVVRYYSIDKNFRPIEILDEDDEWLYLVNFYGQLDNDYILDIKLKKDKLILDNSQAYFQIPINGVNTIYNCRKFFGVTDGAMLYSGKKLEKIFETDLSFERMKFILGRFERTASEFYLDYVSNNKIFSREPIKYMSKLTNNLLHAIEYDNIKEARTKNFEYLNNSLKMINKLELIVPEGAFMYPFYIDNGSEIRKILQAKKIYIPTLWPAVFNITKESELEYDMALNILPLPVDQRYDLNDMRYIIDEIKNLSEAN